MNLEQKTITSLEVAEMMEIKHYQVLEKLEGTKTVKGIIPTITNHNFMVSDYFIESTYTDGSGKENKCYLITKLGCDFLANKFTGEKGILFTARYVKKFRDMEEAIQSGILEGLSTEMKALLMQDKKIQFVLEHIQSTDQRVDNLENNMTIDYGQQLVLKESVNRVVVEHLGGKESYAYKEIGKKVFSEINKDFQRYFNVNSRNNTPKIKFDDAVRYIGEWEPCSNTKLEIRNCNSQMSLV